MKRGVWHQFGSNSQTLAQELLRDHQAGVGVILSPRDLSFKNAVARSVDYQDYGADILFDPQFHVPGFNNAHLRTYSVAQHLASVQKLKKISDNELAELVRSLDSVNRSLHTTAVIAPSVIFEAGQPELAALNLRMFNAAKHVGDAIGVPTYATVFLGRSITGSPTTLTQAVADATMMNADGWYFAFEFSSPDERLPSSSVDVARCCEAGLILAETGKPVLHAYAGPMALLSFGFGSVGAGVSHSQVMWHFHRTRFETPAKKGGGGDAPSRFFSEGLWGTVVDQDETLVFPKDIFDDVINHTPYSSGMMVGLPLARADASRHLVCSICRYVDSEISPHKPREAATRAITKLNHAISIHQRIRDQGVLLKDKTDVYQAPWKNALEHTLTNHAQRYDFLEML